MTIYVFDTSVFIDLFRYYYPDQFPNLWNRFDAMINNNTITSTREVRLELERGDDSVSQWATSAKEIVFPTPTPLEMQFVKVIFAEPNFQKLISKKQRLRNNPVADPFVIARAHCLEQGCVVTEEIYKEGGAKIPNVCEYFGIECINFEGFMKKESWRF